MSAPAPEPRGVLHPRLPQGEFRHERRPPGAVLAGLIEHYWFVAWDLRGLPPQTQETLPHPSVHLVVEPPQARLYGVHQGRFVRVLEGQGRVFGIKFRPGGFRPFYSAEVARQFGVSVRTLNNAVVAIRGMSMHRYTRLRRLWNVRQRLVQGASIEAMKAIALANGFWHMGEFRTLYRDLFGETPQQTCLAVRGADGR